MYAFYLEDCALMLTSIYRGRTIIPGLCIMIGIQGTRSRPPRKQGTRSRPPRKQGSGSRPPKKQYT